MKTIKFLTLLLCLMLIGGCNKDETVTDDGVPATHNFGALLISFQNAVGSDLVKEYLSEWENMTELPEGLYMLDYIYPDVRMDAVRRHNLFAARYPDRFERIYRKMGLMRYNPDPNYQSQLHFPSNDFDRLAFFFNSSDTYWGEPIPPAEWIIVRLSIPYLFGDDVVREFTTYWRECEFTPYLFYCYRIKFDDGRVYIPHRVTWGSGNFSGHGLVTIVLGD